MQHLQIQHGAAASHLTQVSRSIASQEAKAKPKIACLDFNSHLVVFMKSNFAVIEAQEIALINGHFSIE